MGYKNGQALIGKAGTVTRIVILGIGLIIVSTVLAFGVFEHATNHLRPNGFGADWVCVDKSATHPMCFKRGPPHLVPAN
jgi:hypothetical protein